LCWRGGLCWRAWHGPGRHRGAAGRRGWPAPAANPPGLCQLAGRVVGVAQVGKGLRFKEAVAGFPIQAERALIASGGFGEVAQMVQRTLPDRAARAHGSRRSSRLGRGRAGNRRQPEISGFPQMIAAGKGLAIQRLPAAADITTGNGSVPCRRHPGQPFKIPSRLIQGSRRRLSTPPNKPRIPPADMDEHQWQGGTRYP
jgi:hypothetical protein